MQAFVFTLAMALLSLTIPGFIYLGIPLWLAYAIYNLVKFLGALGDIGRS